MAEVFMLLSKVSALAGNSSLPVGERHAANILVRAESREEAVERAESWLVENHFRLLRIEQSGIASEEKMKAAKESLRAAFLKAQESGFAMIWYSKPLPGPTSHAPNGAA